MKIKINKYFYYNIIIVHKNTPRQTLTDRFCSTLLFT